MHFDVLVEDRSGKAALDILIPKIIGAGHSFRVNAYKGNGHLLRKLRPNKGAATRQLLNNLPKLLNGFGKTHAGYPLDYPAAVVLVCDLDDKCKKTFLRQLHGLLDALSHKPNTRFCLAIEEGEAWLLGDLAAVTAAYPNAKMAVLNAYVPDSICGTWEMLADALFAGGAEELRQRGWQATGAEKSKWAQTIAPHMKVDANKSPSFVYFCRKLRELTNG